MYMYIDPRWGGFLAPVSLRSATPSPATCASTLNPEHFYPPPHFSSILSLHTFFLIPDSSWPAYGLKKNGFEAGTNT